MKIKFVYFVLFKGSLSNSLLLKGNVIRFKLMHTFHSFIDHKSAIVIVVKVTITAEHIWIIALNEPIVHTLVI